MKGLMLFVGSVNQLDDIFGASDCGKRVPFGFRNWIKSLETGGITNTLKFGGGYGTVDYERTLVSHCLTLRGLVSSLSLSTVP